MPLSIDDRILLWFLRQARDARKAGPPPRSWSGGRAARIADARAREEATERLAGWCAAPHMGCSQKTVARALRRLEEQGLIEAQGATRSRRWRLTPAGTAAAEALERAIQHTTTTTEHTL